MIQRLVNSARANWLMFDGWALTVLGGGDPLLLPLDRLCNLVYFWLVKDADHDQVRKVDLRLWMPPKGVAAPRESPWSAENETAAFRAFAAQVKGSPSPAKRPE